MPVGANILSCKPTKHGIFIWAAVDTNADKKSRSFALMKTNEDQADIREPHEAMSFIDTIIGTVGNQIRVELHLFELIDTLSNEVNNDLNSSN